MSKTLGAAKAVVGITAAAMSMATSTSPASDQVPQYVKMERNNSIAERERAQKTETAIKTSPCTSTK